MSAAVAMDLVSLLEDHWESHSPVKQPNRTPRHGKSPSGRSPPLQPLDSPVLSSASQENAAVSPAQQASLQQPLSRVSSFASATSQMPSVTSEELEALTSALASPHLSRASLSLDGSKDAAAGLELQQSSKSGIVVSSRHRYDDGLGPAPPLLTAFLLLMAPIWLPLLGFFLLPLVCCWALVAGKNRPPFSLHLCFRFRLHITGLQRQLNVRQL